MDNWGDDGKRGICQLMGKIAWLSPVIFSNSKNGKPVVQVKNIGTILHSSLLPLHIQSFHKSYMFYFQNIPRIQPLLIISPIIHLIQAAIISCLVVLNGLQIN